MRKVPEFDNPVDEHTICWLSLSPSDGLWRHDHSRGRLTPFWYQHLWGGWLCTLHAYLQDHLDIFKKGLQTSEAMLPCFVDRLSGISHRHLRTATVFNGKLPWPLEKNLCTFPSRGMLSMPLFISVFRRSWMWLTIWQREMT